jgi:hypothetical protein
MNIVQKKEDLQDTAKKATYVQQLTAKIIDNLEVSITNLHVRYEDTTSIPGSIFSCGFTIESLSLTTTDETWSSRFVSRDLSKRKETAIHKLGTMENFGVYWNTASTPLVQMTYKEWEAHMLARIFRAIEGTIAAPHSPLGSSYDAGLYLDTTTLLCPALYAHTVFLQARTPPSPRRRPPSRPWRCPATSSK